MRYVMTLGEFLFLKSEVTKHDSVTKIDETDASDGSIFTHDVDITYHYDGIALNFNIVKKHTLAAKVASDQFIERHIDEMILDVLKTATTPIADPVAVVLPEPISEPTEPVVEPVAPVEGAV